MSFFLYYTALCGVMSLISAAAYFADKRKAARGAWRIPEIVLLTLTAMGGALGGLAGVYLLRHKTALPEKYPFAMTVWLSLACQIAVGVLAYRGGAV